MTGPEHYARSEHLLDKAARHHESGLLDLAARLTNAAQVHATLALTAAVALPPDATPNTVQTWIGLCAVKGRPQ